MSEAIVVREATSGDARELARLRYRFRSEIAEPVETETAFNDRCTRWMARRLAKESVWRCWVAERAGVLVGQVWVQRIEKIPNPVREVEYHAYLSSLFVEPALRGDGTGSRLLAAVLDWARSTDAQAVILRATTRSRPLYARNGFVAREDVMEVEI